MGDLSKNFDSKEFACKCGCGYDTISPKLIDRLQDIREEWTLPVVVNSGCRCPVHNASVGGGRNSYHLNGMASDITVHSMAQAAVILELNSDNEVYRTFAGIVRKVFDGQGTIFYPTQGFIHVDVRGYNYFPLANYN